MLLKSLLFATLIVGGFAFALAAAPVALEVDAREISRRILHSRLVIPVFAGPLTLLYPKWIPGEHGPTGPITDLAGLEFTAGSRPVMWRRDPLEMYSFHVEVPAGATSLEVRLDYLAPGTSGGFTAGAMASQRLAVLSWNHVLLYPQGQASDQVTFEAKLTLPPGWRSGTALPVARGGSSTVEFQPVSLTTLVDSPVLMGMHYREIDLTPGSSVPHRLHLAADSAEAIALTPELERAHARLVAEAQVLFGAGHYRAYHFLVALSDHVAHFGLEHHESSDNRSWERAFLDDDRRKLMSGLLPHELVHSWNGKYRRPADLLNPDFSQPMRTELLWIYEGLTTYLGDVLAARSGLHDDQEALENLALDAAGLESRAGRAWRPLADTAVAAQLLFRARGDWANWRRGADFYNEGALIWLEADVRIRQATGGVRSLDDFCRSFFGPPGGPPRVVPYALEDVVAALEEVAALDWRAFFDERIYATAPRVPLGGIEAAGFKLVYDEALPGLVKATEEVRKITDLRHSIGVTLDEEGRIQDVVPGLAAASAGLGPGMQIVAVNERKWTRKLLREAIRASAAGAPLELIVESAERYRTYLLDYRGGERYPRLERDGSRPDLLSAIWRPLTWTREDPAR